jgi:D-glycero-alpha-D-manno-heptose 1-phosphate guanylyltransferase
LIDIIILAGGFGTRLKSLVSEVPKPMAPVSGKPFLEYVLSNFSSSNVSRIIFSLGHLSHIVKDHFGTKHKGIDLVYEIEKEPLGTGGAIKKAIKHCKEKYVLVINGDSFIDLNMDELTLQLKKINNSFIVASMVDDASRYGCLRLNKDKLIGFTEKGTIGPGLINSGYYLIKKNIFLNFNLPKIFSFEKDFLVPNLSNLNLSVFVSNGLFIDIGIPEDYIKAQTIFAETRFHG